MVYVVDFVLHRRDGTFSVAPALGDRKALEAICDKLRANEDYLAVSCIYRCGYDPSVIQPFVVKSVKKEVSQDEKISS